MTSTEPWFVFLAPDGRELCSMTVAGTFDGELAATRELLAYQHGINADDVIIVLHSAKTQSIEEPELHMATEAKE